MAKTWESYVNEDSSGIELDAADVEDAESKAVILMLPKASRCIPITCAIQDSGKPSRPTSRTGKRNTARTTANTGATNNLDITGSMPFDQVHSQELKRIGHHMLPKDQHRRLIL